jgi:nucleotide-binding universal stress UspA family protein
MVNILVPTDLSDLSKIALQYAIKIANATEGNITLLHVINFVEPTMATMRTRARTLEKELVSAATDDLDTMLKDVLKNTTAPIVTRIVKAPSFSDTVIKEAKKLHTDLIVMGTRGASGVKKYVMGSNTTSVIEGSKIPVLAVPELGTFKNLRNVVYASDLTRLEKELKTLVPFLKNFNQPFT